MHASRLDAPPGVVLLQVAAGAEEVIQGMTVVEQLQDALADTVGGLTLPAGPCLRLVLQRRAATMLASLLRHMCTVFWTPQYSI